MSSGKFIVRLDKDHHSQLKNIALQKGLSLNELCMRRLHTPSYFENLPENLLQALIVIQKFYGATIQGIVLFGSWARGDVHDNSDIDVLVVMNNGIKITRSLYTLWEKHRAANTKVEPNFVALPNPEDRVSALWAEVAISGLVLYDASLGIQRYLNAVKHMISEGKIIKKKAHGQNYWIHREVA